MKKIEFTEDELRGIIYTLEKNDDPFQIDITINFIKYRLRESVHVKEVK